MRPIVKLWDACKNVFAWWDKPKNFSENQTETYKIPVYANWVNKDWLVWFTDISKVNEICLTVSWRWTIWFPVIRTSPFVPIVRLIVAIPNENLDIKYLRYSVLWIDFNDTWVAIPQLTVPRFKGHKIPLPPLEIQKNIVAKLDQIFSELDQTKLEIQKNLDNTDELWKSALNQAFQGEWEMKKLGEVCDFVRWPFWWSLKKEIFVKKWFAVYEQQHAIYNQFSDFRYFINDEKFLEMKRFEVYPWDLIMSCSWTMGKVSIVPKNSPKWIINQALLKITPSKLINAEFLKNWMDSKDFQDQIWANTQWAAIQNVASVKVISTLNIPVPTLSEQEKIVEHLDQVSKEVKALKSQYQSQLDNLEELKKSVLDKAFRWELGE